MQYSRSSKGRSRAIDVGGRPREAKEVAQKVFGRYSMSPARCDFTGDFNPSAEERAVVLWVSVFAGDTRPSKLWTTRQAQSSLLMTFRLRKAFIIPGQSSYSMETS